MHYDMIDEDMKMSIYITLTLIILFPWITIATEITVLNDEMYFPFLHQELINAKESIYAELFLIKPAANKKDTPTWALLEDLAAAQRRGTPVKVLLEKSIWEDPSHEAYSFLKENGISVSYDDPEKITHSKLVIIDSRKTFIGSSNWTYFSLKANHETNVMIDSKPLAKAILSRNSYSNDLILLDENNYFSQLIKSIQNAKTSIHVLLYKIELNPKKTYTPTYKVLHGLINAHKRGVKVKVILDQNFSDTVDKKGKRKTTIQRKNMSAANFLSQAGIEVSFDTVTRSTHAKIVIIDNKLTILGSQNWTNAPPSKADQVSCLIKSTPIAHEFIEYISKIELASSKHKKDIYDEDLVLRLPWKFFYNYKDSPYKPISKTAPGSKLFTSQAHKTLNLYLLLLQEWDGSTNGEVKIDYEKLAKEMGYTRSHIKDKDTKFYKQYYYKRIAKLLRKLDKRYGLIRYNDKKDLVQLLGYEHPRPYQEPFDDYVKIPITFWKYNWHNSLSFNAEYLYFINLLEKQRSDVWPRWYRSQEDISKMYGINPISIIRGQKELRRYDLIEMEGDPWKPGKAFSDRLANRYFVNELLPPSEIERRWQELAKKYGKEKLKKARKLADKLNEPNDHQVAEQFMQIMEIYNETNVIRATAETIKLAQNNPKRNIGYVIQILRAWEKEGKLQ